MAKVIAYLCQPGDGPEGQLVRLADPDVQRQAVREWAKARRHKVIAFLEDGPPGRVEERLGWVDAIAALQRGDAEGLVLKRLADLDQDLIVQEQLLAELRRLGARVYSVSREDAAELRKMPSDPTRQVVRQALAAAEDNAQSMIALRSRVAASRAGPPGFGYRLNDGEVAPDGGEQSCLARIAQLRASGASLREMARMLDAEGYPARRAAKWHPETLRRIVNRLEP
jgi:DNA invertase Pin-like site-specific DNA recombinase